MRDYSGFNAVVGAIERARESVNSIADRQLDVTRVIRDDLRQQVSDQQLQLPVLKRMVEVLRARFATVRNDFTLNPRHLEARNLKLEAGSVTLSARSVIVETRSGLSASGRPGGDSQLARAIGREMGKITLKTSERIDPLKNISLGFLQFGVGGYLGSRFTGGFERGIGFSTKKVGKSAGRAAGTPLDLANQFKKGFFNEDEGDIYSDEDDGDDTASGGSPKKPKPNRPGGSGGGKTFGKNLWQRIAFDAGKSASKSVDREDTTHATIDLWAEESKKKNLRFLVPQLIERFRQDAEKKVLSDREIFKAVEGRKSLLKSAIAKEEKLPSDKQAELQKDRKARGVLSPKERLEFVEFLQKHRKDLLTKYGKLLFRFQGQNKLKFEELMSIYYYTEASGYREMNEVLRGKSKDLAENLGVKEEHLLESSSRNTLAAISGLNRLPSYKGKTYRGLDFKSIGIDPNEHYKVGEVIEEKGFTSTTKNQSMRYPGDVVWEITNRKGGKDISSVEAFTNEEVLYPPNSKFKVTGKRKVKKLGREFWVIQMEDMSESKADFARVAPVPEIKIEETSPNNENDPKSPEISIESNSKTETRPNPRGARPDRPADAGVLGRVEPNPSPGDNGDTQTTETGRGRIDPVEGEFNRSQTRSRLNRPSFFADQDRLESVARKVIAELEIAPNVWVNTDRLNDGGFSAKISRQFALIVERTRLILQGDVRRTLMGILGTIPGTMIGRGLTGDALGGYAGGLVGRLIGETGFEDISNFRSLQKKGLSPATTEFWHNFGDNRKFLPNKLRKTAVGYGTGAVVGRGIGDVMQVTGAGRVLSSLLPSWVETTIGDSISRVIKTIADPNIDLTIPKLPPPVNKLLSAPLHALGKGAAGENFVGNLGFSFLEGQTKTALLPLREALSGAGKSLGGGGIFGEYLGDRFDSLGIGAIQGNAPLAARGMAGTIAPGLPAHIRNFIADQVVNGTVMDGFVQGKVAPKIAEKATGDIFARTVKVPLTGKVSGKVNETLDRIDPFPTAPSGKLSDEQLLIEREKRLQKRSRDNQNIALSLYGIIDKNIDATTKTIVGIANGFLGVFDKMRTKGSEFASKTAGLSDKPIKLIDRYVLYLDNLIQEASESASDTIATLIPNYSDLTIPQKRDLAKNFSAGVTFEIKKFRMAVEDGENEIAAEVGERLLAMIQYVRAIYKDLLKNLPEDYSGTRSIRGQMSNLTNVQNEVLRGQPNMKGRAGKGLVQVVGEDTGEGFVGGIEERLAAAEAAGENLGQEAIDGAKNRLGIASPSKVFEEIGENVVEGFERGVSDLEDLTIEQLESFASAADEGIAGFIGNARAGFTSFFDGLMKRFPVLKELTDLLLGLGAGFVVGNALENFAGWLVNLANSSFDAVTGLESIRKALISVTGSSERGARGLAFVREEAKRLGVDLKTAEEAYTGLKAVTRFTPLQGEQSDRIFSSFSETAAARGLSNEEQSRMFAAINQMISKRKLSAEEVRGQLGEIPGLAFESTLSRSLGVNPAQLNEMMGNGQLMVEDVLPKVSAQYAAETAAISGSSETTAQAMNRLNNAILSLQRGFEGWVAGSKPLFNILASGLEAIVGLMPAFAKALIIFTSVLLGQSIEAYIKFIAQNKILQSVLVNTIKTIGSFFRYIVPEILSFVKTFALMTLAFDAVGNAIKLSQNAFPEMRKQIDETTASANALESAFKNAGLASKNINPDLPVREEDITTNEGWNILGINTPFNLEWARKQIAKEQRSQRERMEGIFGSENLPPAKILATAGQARLADFQKNIGDSLQKIDGVLSRQFDTKKVIDDIKEIDKQLTTMRSRRFNIPAGDREAYNQSIAEEQKVLEERDKKLKITSSFQQNLENNKAAIEANLKGLDELVAKKGITADAEASIRAQLEERLGAIEKTRVTFEDLMASVAKSVNALSLALRNLNENAAYFNETLERNATNARVQFLRRARGTGLGSQVSELGTDRIDRQTLEARVTFLKDQLGAVNEYLSKPDFAALLEELRTQAKEMGLNLENTATIDRLIGENRSGQETAVLEALKQQLALKDQLGQTEETLERSITQAKTTLIDLNRSVEDYFFNLTQQIKEALVEVDRLVNQLEYGNLKTKLQRALVPGSDTFVNGLVSQIQGIFDQAASITEQILGQKSARINFAGERRGLQVELQNFTNSLGGATEAIEGFKKALLGGQNNKPTLESKANTFSASSPSGGANSRQRALILAANEIGLKPEELAAIISWETGGTFNPDKVGGEGNRYRGLIQFGPSERRQFGVSPGQSFEDQLKSVVAYFQARGFKPGMGLLRAYATVLGGNPNVNLNARDSFGTSPMSAFLNQLAPGKPHYVNAMRFLGGAARTVASTPVVNPIASTPVVNVPSADSTRARDLTETLIKIKNRTVNLGDASVRQEIENFVINLQQTRETILRQMSDSIRTSRQSVTDTKNQFTDTRRQYSPQTQTSQVESDLQGIQTQFSTLDTQLFEQERGLQDNIKGLQGLLGQLTPVIQVLRSSGNAVDKQSADFLQGLVGQIEGDKKSYEGMLAEISGLRGQLKAGKIDAENFVQAQARLRQVQSDLERIGTELAIAQSANNAEMERSIGLLQSRQQLEADILQISNDFADNETERLKRIELAREQARLREVDIQYQYESKQLTKELELIEKRVSIAQSLSNLEKRKELALLQSVKQLEQEILEIKKQYPDLAEQELRIQLAREQAGIRERDIKNQFVNDSLSRREETSDLDSQISEGYASRLEAGGDTFGASAIRERSAMDSENLRYQRQVEGIRQQYADDPARTDELVKKATILRDLNLQNIDRQFKDLGETIESVAGDAFGNFFTDVLTGTKSLGDAFADMAVSILKSIAQIAAQMAVTSLFKAIGFGFNEGGTVENHAEGGTIGEALRKEGPRGVVAVFTPGEEILSIKTGEAGRYQKLKGLFGKNPLKNVFNFADGGTVADNLLNNLGSSSVPRTRLSPDFGGQSFSSVGGDRSVNITVVTPDVGGFNRSERQIGRAAAELLRRS